MIRIEKTHGDLIILLWKIPGCRKHERRKEQKDQECGERRHHESRSHLTHGTFSLPNLFIIPVPNKPTQQIVKCISLPTGKWELPISVSVPPLFSVSNLCTFLAFPHLLLLLFGNVLFCKL